MESKQRIYVAVFSLLATIVIGVFGLSALEGWDLFEALWCTVITMTTTGFGDRVPQTTGGKSFLMIILIVGISVVAYSVSSITEFLIESQIANVAGRRKIMRQIQQLENHIIICGGGRVGSNVAFILRKEQVPYVVVEADREIIDSLDKFGYMCMPGDATRDEALIEAGIMRAKGIVTALPGDAYNLYVTLTARALRPDIKIVARAERPENAEKLGRAGADRVISPEQIGGFKMAMGMLKPNTVDLITNLFSSTRYNLQMEEMSVSESSPLANKSIIDALNRDKYNVIVVSIIRGEVPILNPKGVEIIQPDDILIVVGSEHELRRVEDLFV